MGANSTLTVYGLRCWCLLHKVAYRLSSKLGGSVGRTAISPIKTAPRLPPLSRLPVTSHNHCPLQLTSYTGWLRSAFKGERTPTRSPSPISLWFLWTLSTMFTYLLTARLSVSRFGLAVEHSAGKQKDLGSIRLRLSALFNSRWEGGGGQREKGGEG